MLLNLTKNNYFILVFLFFTNTLSFAQFTITEDFKGQVSSNIILGDDAKLTSGVNDPVGSGWLRLTPDLQSRKGFAYINKTFPSSLGILVDFEFKMWRTRSGNQNTNEGGDGFSVYLFDGATTTAQFQLGGYGGSLGYARNKEGGNNLSGLKNGYLGIGFDAYGNYVNKNAPNKFTGTTVTIPNSIGLRGRTSLADDATSNPFLKAINISGVGLGTVSTITANQAVNPGNGWQNHLDYNFASGTSSGTYPLTRPADSEYYRRVQIEIKPVAGNMFDVIIRWKREGQNAFTEIMRYTTSDIPPATLKLGFAASTGWAVNYHEIRNLLVTTPGNLRVMKKANKDVLRSVSGTSPNNQNQVTYTIEVSNETSSTLSNVSFKDRITDGQGNLVSAGNSNIFSVTGITTSGFVSTTLPSPTVSNPLTSNEITGSLNMNANSVGVITVTGTLNKIPLGNLLTNTVTVLPTDIQDQDLENNTSFVKLPVNGENVDLSVQETVDEDCLDTVNGNVFTLTPFNYGSVINYGGVAIVSASGSTRNYSRNRLEVSFQFPAGSTTTLQALPSGWEEIIVGVPANTKLYRTTSLLPNSGFLNDWGDQNNNQSLNTGFGGPEFNFKVLNANSFSVISTANIVRETGTVTRSGLLNYTYTFNAASAITTSLDNVPANNTITNTVFITPTAVPVVAKDTIKYCLGQSATTLVATTTNSAYTLNWYSSLNGVKLQNAPIPPTTSFGTMKYYVSQSNGTCEGPLKEITVVVKDCRVITNPILINQSRK